MSLLIAPQGIEINGDTIAEIQEVYTSNRTTRNWNRVLATTRKIQQVLLIAPQGIEISLFGLLQSIEFNF